MFCEIVAGRVPAFVVYEDSDTLAFLDRAPLMAGHVLVVPRAHIETLEDLENVEPLFSEVQRIARAVENALEADGTFVAVNNKVSQSVPHLHVHVVPRKKGDGLRGFFWPRQKYESDQERSEYAARIAKSR